MKSLRRLKDVSDRDLQQALLNAPDSLLIRALSGAPEHIQEKILKNISSRRAGEAKRVLSEQEEFDEHSVRAARTRLISLLRDAGADFPEEEERKDPIQHFKEAVIEVEDILTGSGNTESKKEAILKLCRAFPSAGDAEERIRSWAQDRLEDASEDVVVEKSDDEKKFQELFDKLEAGNPTIQKARKEKEQMELAALLKTLLQTGDGN